MSDKGALSALNGTLRGWLRSWLQIRLYFFQKNCRSNKTCEEKRVREHAQHRHWNRASAMEHSSN